MRRLLVVALALLLTALARPAHAQLKGVRFEVTTVGDTTVSFQAGTEHWLRPGIEGIAVDPMKRDVLVARLRVLRVEKGGEVTAVVTGQTTAVTTEHVVLIQERRLAWYRRRTFWGGFLVGAALGATAGAKF
jgi:hypothetical protein